MDCKGSYTGVLYEHSVVLWTLLDSHFSGLKEGTLFSFYGNSTNFLICCFKFPKFENIHKCVEILWNTYVDFQWMKYISECSQPYYQMFLLWLCDMKDMTPSSHTQYWTQGLVMLGKHSDTKLRTQPEGYDSEV